MEASSGPPLTLTSSNESDTQQQEVGRHPLLVLYDKLSTRHVDLVGDFAGSNLLVLEGDSLLLTCFSDKSLDFGDGFQLLHAVFLVERFLQRLVERRCNIEIVFFDQHERLCIPPGTLSTRTSKYLLAREVIIEHLRNNTKIETARFGGLTDSHFKQYLEQHDAYCFLCHDGDLGQDSEEDSKTLPYRAMILYLIRLRYNIALCHELEWKDTKVSAPHLSSSQAKQRKGPGKRH